MLQGIHPLVPRSKGIHPFYPNIRNYSSTCRKCYKLIIHLTQSYKLFIHLGRMGKAFLHSAQMYKQFIQFLVPKCYKSGHLSIRLLWSEIWWSCDQSSFFHYFSNYLPVHTIVYKSSIDQLQEHSFPLFFLTIYLCSQSSQGSISQALINYKSSEWNSDSSWNAMSFFFLLKTWVPRALNMINYIFSTHLHPLSQPPTLGQLVVGRVGYHLKSNLAKFSHMYLMWK
jgi:hypothetical protein